MRERGVAGGEAGGRGNRMAGLYLIVLRGYSSQWSAVRLPVWMSMGGIKPMPNSFMGRDVEKWPIIKSHRRTAGDQTHKNVDFSASGTAQLAIPATINSIKQQS